MLILGHAYSKDLVDWVNLPIALKPDNLGSIWSGSAVVDKLNTSGFGQNSLICIYTSAGGETYESSDEKFTISLAYSTDGMIFNKYNNNPIVSNISRGNRDPKVFWYFGRWIMVISLNSKTQGFQFLHSSNLIDWTKMCTTQIDGLSDCPDIIHLADSKVLFFGTDGKYIVGTLGNEEFTVDSELHQFAYGETYSSQTWNNEPNNKHIMIFRLGDMENSKHISQMSMPIELNYTEQSGKLYVQPLQSIIYKFITNWTLSHNFKNDVLMESEKITLNTCQFYLVLDLQYISGVSVIELIDGTIRYDGNTFSYNTFNFNLPGVHEVNLQIISDVNSIEIFVNREKYIGCFQYGNAYNLIKFDNVHIKNLLLYENI